MTNTELENAFNQAISNLKEAKEKKVSEFEATIKEDLNDFIEAGDISKEHCEAYFINLKDALEEKEQEIDVQIKKETERLVNDYLLKLKDVIKMDIVKSNSINLTDTVLDASMDYFEVKIAELAVKPKKPTPTRISDRLSNIIPTEMPEVVEGPVEEAKVAEEVKPVENIQQTTSDDDVLNEIFGGMESNEKTIDELIPMIEEDIEETFDDVNQVDDTEIDDAIEELISRVMVPQNDAEETTDEVEEPAVMEEVTPIAEETTEEETKEEPTSERVSTVDLEKLLEEVRNLM